MPVPDYQSLMLPVLKALADSTERPISEVRERVAAAERLTPDDLREMLASGQPMFTNRVSWAVMYMERAGLVERVRRAIYRLTEEGKRLLAQAPARVDLDVLRTYPDYVAWLKKANAPSTRNDAEPISPDESTNTPEEALHRIAQQLRGELEAEVLDRVRKADSAFLEQVVVDLLISMGYGGGDAAMGRVIGRSGDGGIDGAIKEDALGLNEVYIQAKKYADSHTVGESDLRNFAGAINAAPARPRAYSSPPPALHALPRTM